MPISDKVLPPEIQPTLTEIHARDMSLNIKCNNRKLRLNIARLTASEEERRAIDYKLKKLWEESS